MSTQPHDSTFHFGLCVCYSKKYCCCQLETSSIQGYFCRLLRLKPKKNRAVHGMCQDVSTVMRRQVPVGKYPLWKGALPFEKCGMALVHLHMLDNYFTSLCEIWYAKLVERSG